MSVRFEQRSVYRQFCPIALASEIFCSRWTPLVLREMICGSRRFNDIRRGLPRISPTLLSKRLKELEKAGLIVERKRAKGGSDYRLTPAGDGLRGVVMSLGLWGNRWIESSVSLKNLDPSLLMWDMRRRIAPAMFPKRRCIVKFLYTEASSGRRSWWVIAQDGAIDVCLVDPGYDVDLYVRSSLRSMTSVWMGYSTLKAELEAGNITVEGDKTLARSMQQWLGLGAFAKEKRHVS
ncbi:MAG TPA: helix-turn-helix domain-containing protein [Pseudolabrys sp.]|jgi:DNA-binding HxlR family transcriptional regulator